MTTPTVVQALSAVMNSVQKIAKDGFNEQQKFDFRGIDATMKAVGPALREHGVVVVPVAEEITKETYETKKGTVMRNVTLLVRFVFYGPAGDSIEAVAYGEAADSGDKAVSKAHSVAFRTVLLQALCIPTGDPDPDSSSHERSGRSYEQERPMTRLDKNDPQEMKRQIWNLGRGKEMTADAIQADFAEWSKGLVLADVTDAKLLRQYATHLEKAGV